MMIDNNRVRIYTSGNQNIAMLTNQNAKRYIQLSATQFPIGNSWHVFLTNPDLKLDRLLLYVCEVWWYFIPKDPLRFNVEPLLNMDVKWKKKSL